jgi:tetratricopeptide (TPR) repeat protein
MSPNSCWRKCAFFLIVIVAIAIAKTSVGQGMTAENWRRLGREAFDQGRYSEAERDFRLALEEFGKRGNSFETAQTLEDVANLWVAEERYSDAEQLLDRALKMMAGEVDPHPHETSRLLGNLGALYGQTARPREAEAAFNRALRLLEQYEPHDRHMVVLFSSLGALHAREGNDRHAWTDLRKALDFELARTLEEFSRLLHAMKSHEPTGEMEARARRIRAELAYTRSVSDEF